MATGFNSSSRTASDNESTNEKIGEIKDQEVNQLEKNKLAQRLFRKRRKEYLKGLEEQVESYEKAKTEIMDLTKRNNEMLWMMERANSFHACERANWQKERYEMSQIIHNLQAQIQANDRGRRMSSGIF